MSGNDTHEFTLRFRVVDEAKLRDVYAELCAYADATDMNLTAPGEIGVELIYNLDVIADMRREQSVSSRKYVGWDDLGLERI